ncbi:MAG TPA: ABC transporter ATP-binding protein [Acidimicrobiia bacterium]|nr:ABC transporter ATP-binding protein [Acidimicrobiia bacterium]
MSEDQPVLLLDDVHKLYNPGPLEVPVLKGISLAVEEGDFVAITGSSGGGKSTMLNILGCLDTPTTGRYLINGSDVSRLSGNELARVRNRYLGFVFQGFNLIKRTTALANVELPLVYGGVPVGERRKRALTALELVGLGGRVDHMPNELSGGQQQRVAIARAIATGPAVILADEPTGNLDPESTEDVLDIFAQLNTAGRTILLITHEQEVAARAKRVIVLADGRIASDERHAPVDGPPPGPPTIDLTEEVAA